MNWNSINFDWNRARAFLVTAEEKSFTAAAKALNLTQSTLGRQVSALEEELGVTLFERVGKGIEITPSGLELVECIKEMANAANKLSFIASGKSVEISGRVAITCNEVMSAFVLPNFVKKIRKTHPGISVEIVASNETKDLRRREADIAIRNHSFEHPDLVMVKVKSSKIYLYASQEFLKTYGPIKNKKSFKKLPIMGLPENSKWMKTLTKMGLEVEEANFPIVTDSHLVHWSIVKQGLAIGAMPENTVRDDKDLKRVLKSLPGIPIDTWVVSHKELKTNRRIRFVYENLVTYLNEL